MQMLEVELQQARERFGYDRDDGDDARWFRVRLAETVGDPRLPLADGAGPTEWCGKARAAARKQVDTAAEWGREEPPPSLG